jgi:hypothetical protein
MFIVYDDSTGAFMATVDVANVRPDENGLGGSEIRQHDDSEILHSPLPTSELLRRLTAA